MKTDKSLIFLKNNSTRIEKVLTISGIKILIYSFPLLIDKILLDNLIDYLKMNKEPALI